MNSVLSKMISVNKMASTCNFIYCFSLRRAGPATPRHLNRFPFERPAVEVRPQPFFCPIEKFDLARPSIVLEEIYRATSFRLVFRFLSKWRSLKATFIDFHRTAYRPISDRLLFLKPIRSKSSFGNAKLAVDPQ